jgi:hypothetical protein
MFAFSSSKTGWKLKNAIWGWFMIKFIQISGGPSGNQRWFAGQVPIDDFP